MCRDDLILVTTRRATAAGPYSAQTVPPCHATRPVSRGGVLGTNPSWLKLQGSRPARQLLVGSLHSLFRGVAVHKPL